MSPAITLVSYGVAVAFVVAAIAMPCIVIWCVRQWSRYRPPAPYDPLSQGRVPPKVALIFVVPVAVGFIGTDIVEFKARQEVALTLASLTPPVEVLIDGHPLGNPLGLIQVLEGVGPRMGHHSHPDGQKVVDLRSGARSIRLTIGRDSTNKQEYWVYTSLYSVLTPTYIGTITTAVLDGY